MYHASHPISIPPSFTRSTCKQIAVQFNGGQMTSDVGVLLLPHVDRKLRLTERINELICDPRDQRLVKHLQGDLLAQRIYGIAMGYEDGNDHTKLRKNPALLTAIKSTPDEECPLGSASTLSRLENRITDKELSALSKLPLEVFIESYEGKEPPKQIIIDVDATDDQIHGEQEGRHFSGFYDGYIFLPLFFYCGDQLLWARLRTADKGGAFGALAIFRYIVQRIKKAFPRCEIILRGDAGFYTPGLLNYCDRYGYKYILGFSSNSVLKRLSQPVVIATKLFFKDAGSKESFRLFEEYFYRAGSWNYARSIIAKAERLPDGRNACGKENTRFIVTNLLGDPQYLYEEVYCARGEMENRIKEVQLMLFSDRTSCHGFRANCFRLLLSCYAYILMETIRRTALHGTPMERAQCGTIREKLFKIAAVVKVSVRRIVFSLPTSCPVQDLWLRVYDRLRWDRLHEVLPLPSS